MAKQETMERIAGLLGGNGAMGEQEILKRLSISHGTFFAAIREMIASGRVKARTDGRKKIYCVTDGAQAAPPEDKAGGAASPSEGEDEAKSRQLDEMRESLLGTFTCYEEWTANVYEQLGEHSVIRRTDGGATVTTMEGTLKFSIFAPEDLVFVK